MPTPQSTEVTPRRKERSALRTDWICAGRAYWHGEGSTASVVSRTLESLGGFSDRVAADRWVRYRIDLASAPPPDSHVTLTPLNENLVESLRGHADYANKAFSSGLAFWELGLRTGFVWFEADQPLCVQWLLEEIDVATLRARSPWANMYPPLPPRTGQLEKLFTFSTARQKGIATRFAMAIFANARGRGLTSLQTHIPESNTAAHSWARKTGWQPYGSIVRYRFDVPLMHRLNLSVCEHRLAAEQQLHP